MPRNGHNPVNAILGSFHYIDAMRNVLNIAGLLGLTLTGIVYVAVFQNMLFFSSSIGAQFEEMGFALFAGMSGVFCLWYAFKQLSTPRPLLSAAAFGLSLFIVVVMGTLYDGMRTSGADRMFSGFSAIWWLAPLAAMSAMPLLRDPLFRQLGWKN